MYIISVEGNNKGERMKAYVQFCETRTTTFNNTTMKFESCEPVQVDCIGSAGVFTLDGRNSLDTMIYDAMEQVKRLHNIKPYITSFKIIQSERIGDGGKVLANVVVDSEQLPNGIKHTFKM
jgi:hypothetical protein